MDKNIAISVQGISKTFKIPHEKISSLRGAFVNVFKKNTFEEFQALNNVSFEVRKGEFFGIIGRNGSGKSTLLKILAGIYQPDKVYPVKSSRADAKHLTGGRIYPVKSGESGAKLFHHGVTVNGLISPFLELGIGFNPELSGRDNVYLNATVLGLSQKQISEKFDRIVAFSELERFIDQKLKNYSSGMQVRLAFSVAIHANRDILLMDEVLAVGDTNFQSKCLEEFNKYKELGKTVILVTHDIATVQRYCDRALLLRNGKVVKIGKAEEVGNEYVYQNMSDEERRIIDDQKQKESDNKNIVQNEVEVPRSQSQKIAEITSVEFLDTDGKIKNVFETGDDMIARIRYKAEKRIEKPVFGVAIHTQYDILIAGPNTKTSKFGVDFIEGAGHVDFEIKNNHFYSGTYKFTAALFDWSCITPFDFKDKTYNFKVISQEENQNGIVKLEIAWKK